MSTKIDETPEQNNNQGRTEIKSEVPEINFGADCSKELGQKNTPGTDIAPPAPRRLPKIEELLQDKEMAQKQNELNILLNQDPPASWLRPHPTATMKVPDPNKPGEELTVPVPYIPIARIEWLLTSVFLRYSVTIKEAKMVANSVLVVVTLKVQDPLTGEWIIHDGLGAVDIQTSKGAGAMEFDKINHGAIMKGAPAAESYAIKDAAEKLGKLFGKDISRKDYIAFDNLQKKEFIN